MSKQVLFYLWKKGYTSREIAVKMNSNKSAVLKLAKKYGIKFVHTYDYPNTIDSVVVKKLAKRLYSNSEIAKMLNTTKNTINTIKQRNNIDSSKYKLKKYYKESNIGTKQFALLAGCLLGDGSINGSGYFSCAHSSAQRDYCKWKADFLSQTLKVSWKEDIARFDKRTNKTYYSCIFGISQISSFLKKWREELYVPKKIITEDFLKRYYTDLSLAIHFMDDGYKTNSSYRIATNGFDKESLEAFISFCREKFKINFVVRSENRLYLPIRYKERFEKIIMPYIHPTLMYKIHN